MNNKLVSSESILDKILKDGPHDLNEFEQVFAKDNPAWGLLKDIFHKWAYKYLSEFKIYFTDESFDMLMLYNQKIIAVNSSFKDDPLAFAALYKKMYEMKPRADLSISMPKNGGKLELLVETLASIISLFIDDPEVYKLRLESLISVMDKNGFKLSDDSFKRFEGVIYFLWQAESVFYNKTEVEIQSFIREFKNILTNNSMLEKACRFVVAEILYENNIISDIDLGDDYVSNLLRNQTP
jgi:hypothetical protein